MGSCEVICGKDLLKFLLIVFSQLRAPMMTSLLRKLVIDVPALTENTVVPLRVIFYFLLIQNFFKMFNVAISNSNITKREYKKKNTGVNIKGIIFTLNHHRFGEFFSSYMNMTSYTNHSFSLM